MYDLFLGDAIELAAQKHRKQVDKQGLPYILHVLHVIISPRLTSDFERVCAALHDIIEDTDVSAADLRSMGFPGDVVQVVSRLSRPPHLSYDDYMLKQVLGDCPEVHILLAAIRIKLADLDHHISRLHTLSFEDRDRLGPRYILAHEILEVELARLIYQ